MTVLYAGSLATVMEDHVGPAFEKDGGVDFQGEAHGSLGAARLIQDRLRTPDVFVSADPSVNQTVLMGSENDDLVTWFVTLASSQLVLAYNPKSRFAGDFEAAAAGTVPWYEVLAKPGLRFGRGDPTIDPKGYRTLFLFTLAAEHYGRPDIPGLLGDPLNPAQVLPEVALLARIDSGQFDAGIFYKHEVVAHELPYVTLPPRDQPGRHPILRSLRPGHLHAPLGRAGPGGADSVHRHHPEDGAQPGRGRGIRPLPPHLPRPADRVRVRDRRAPGGRGPEAGPAGSAQPEPGYLRAVMRRRPTPTLVVFGALGGLLLLVLVLPIANLLLHADWARWTTALRDPRAGDALRTSLVTSAIAVVIMTLFGVPLGYVLARSRLRFKQLLIGLVFLPMVAPGLAGGILLLQTFGPYGSVGGPLAAWDIALTSNRAGIVLAQLYVSSPFVVIAALVAFSNVDPKLEMAAATLGDSPWHVFRRVSLPLAWPGIAAGITLGWIRALGEFGATMIVAYNPHTLPVYLWVRFQANGLTGALPVAFLLVVLAAAAVALSMVFGRRTVDGRVVPVPAGGPGSRA